MTDTAEDTARAQLASALVALRNPDGGWPYYRGRRSRLEPTCWAMLATGTRFDATPLAAWLGDDGLFSEPGAPHANYAFNGLAAMAIGATAAVHVRTRLVSRLAEVRGEAIVGATASRQDSTLQGWSWMPGTFSWVEPTAWCTLALKRFGRTAASADRIAVGERLLRNRVCADGGWNYGNPEVLGQLLTAHVPPTATAVLALQDHAGDDLVTRAAAFLAAHGPREGSTTSLAMSAIALDVTSRGVPDLRRQLAARAPDAITFGNAANIAMAAVALAGSSAVDALRLPQAV